MSSSAQPIDRIRERISQAADGRQVDLLAVSKTRSDIEVRALAESSGQRAFGENYVQEAMAKREALADLGPVWHLIGHLQSNKCREAAETFDWIDSIDRAKLIAPLARFRPADRAPLNLLIQVNIDDEDSKSGCRPDQIEALAAAIAAESRLKLRGLMAIPAPGDPASLRRAFAAMRQLFERLRATHRDADTLSMGMSDDFELAIAEGATQVRIGTALFGPRPGKS
ncbi:YggS family pyridoxal phosphate-dependent enzyme [Pseudomarimonas salicorniae]|uniref:Pyridoxal phosphate homeostasis protein n=1 Tax=Pseudomarimonas salicorniae TaxID=2933270 RepID=A0ABT0GIJ0_9GAMM|nr:YggS family pyridoxal phosphate-dependent enzyme [Lysobacter sp. CAU 1642]MCK7594369.1 YggS family pyridoxal phosphate-dependent enzyme [Lysobacter sp. CAU 1642]